MARSKKRYCVAKVTAAGPRIVRCFKKKMNARKKCAAIKARGGRCNILHRFPYRVGRR